MTIEPIGFVHCAFEEKFGLPRQPGLAPIEGRVVLEPPYRDESAFRGLDAFSHIWLIWEFSAYEKNGTFSPTVRPPRLGGNTRLGVFATRSPNRPNRLGLSCVRLLGVERDERYGPVLRILGGDMRHMTPVYDIKPYIAYADAHPDAVSGFAAEAPAPRLRVLFTEKAEMQLAESEKTLLEQTLRFDPRPSYAGDTDKIYGMMFAGKNVRFTVRGEELTVTDVQAPQAQKNQTWPEKT